MAQILKVYLAGPTVFFKNALEIAAGKKEILAKYGMQGFFPLDNEISPELFLAPQEAGYKIGELNYKMMDECDAVIADLTPFRGVSADPGTFGECMYMFGKGKIVNGYSHDARQYGQRCKDDFYQGKTEIGADKVLRGSDGHSIENFHFFDNLMLLTAIRDSGGLFHAGSATDENDLGVFEDAVFKINQKLKLQA